MLLYQSEPLKYESRAAAEVQVETPLLRLRIHRRNPRQSPKPLRPFQILHVLFAERDLYFNKVAISDCHKFLHLLKVLALCKGNWSLFVSEVFCNIYHDCI